MEPRRSQRKLTVSNRGNTVSSLLFFNSQVDGERISGKPGLLQQNLRMVSYLTKPRFKNLQERDYLK